MLTSIVDGDSRAVHIGMPVEVAFGWLPIKSASLLQAGRLAATPGSERDKCPPAEFPGRHFRKISRWAE